MKIVVGLGNPGKQYISTRHNAGFRVVDLLAEQTGTKVGRWKFRCHMGKTFIGDEDVVLAKPQRLMNLSGPVVRDLLEWFDCPDLENMLIICDDWHLPLGTIRVRGKGSAGGHKGLQSIINILGTVDFPRLRIGIGPCRGSDPTEFVLSKFKRSERKEIEEATSIAADAVTCWAGLGLDVCMNRFN